MTLHSLLLLFVLLQGVAGGQPGSIQGAVLESGTGRPLEGVTVELRGSGTPSVLMTTDTRNDGTFVFRRVPPGSFFIEATRAGYIPLRNQRQGTRPPALTIGPGEVLSGISVTLVPGGVIYGRVVDDRGEAVGGAVVEALKTTYENGQGWRALARETVSNDLGEYRLFALPPGEYAIRTTTPSLEAASLSFDTLTVPPLYFPGTIDADEARNIPLRPGEAVGGVDFFSLPTRPVRVVGQVFGANGAGTKVMLFPRNSPAAIEQSVDAESGIFQFRGILPGRYMLVARSVSQQAALSLDVGNVDVTGLRITLGSGYRIPSMVRIDGHAAGDDPGVEKLYFAVRPEPEITGLDVVVYSPFADGHFTLSLLAGDYRIELQRPEDFYIKSVKLGETDVLIPGLRVTGSSDTPLEILVGASPGSVEGRSSKGGVTVVLVPDSPFRGQRGLYKSVKAGSSGEFRFANVPPGNYKLFAWQAENGGPWLDPHYLNRYESGGIPIYVEEGSKADPGRAIPVLD